jgi:uncharacterized ion transporter superfamily protein YfcC
MSAFGATLERIRLPHVFVLLTFIVALAALSTYVVPSGRYERVKRSIEGRERTLVVPGTYAAIPKAVTLEGMLLAPPDPTASPARPVSFTGFLSAIPRGMVESADIIFFIFIIGGAFGIVQRTGTIHAGVGWLIDRLGHSGPLLTAVVMLALAAGGSTLGMGEEFIPLVPVFLLISARLGYDRLYGVAIVILGATVGFGAATTNPFTVNVAQGIAELPLNSGLPLRLAFFALAVPLGIVHVLRYGRRLARDPAASLVRAEPEPGVGSAAPAGRPRFDGRHLAILGVTIAIFAAVLWGVQFRGWWMTDMAGGFLFMGIAAAAIARLSLPDAAAGFVRGMEEMVVAALVVGFARGVTVVLGDGQILDTLIHSAATTLGHWPPAASAGGMLLFQTTLNVLIPSGSGQATVTMPVMAPLADVLGLTRQTAVLAFQFGDGLSNIVIPTSGTLMAMLALARVPFATWLRFVLPLLMQLMALAAIFMLFAVATGYR